MAKAGFVESILRTGSRTWRRFAPTQIRGAAGPVMAAFARRQVFAAIAGRDPEFTPGPLVVSGFLSETRGISQAARLTLSGLRAAGYSVIDHDLRPLLSAGPGNGASLPVERPGGVWIIHANPVDAGLALAYAGATSWVGRYRIGYWVHEVPAIPSSWARWSGAFHEIWTPSLFSKDALLAAGITTPVRIMPHPVALGRLHEATDRSTIGIPAGAFVVLVMADLHSSAERKNLAGAFEIYNRAFPEITPTRCLVVKVQSRGMSFSSLAALRTRAMRRRDIVWVDESLSTADTQRLIASSDVLLSPHRSEGFGLHLAEALMLGTPALATAWSGNLDFMSELPELLIRHKLVPVRDPQGIYATKGVWAEPDIVDAARKLKALSESPSLRAEVAAKGKGIVETLSLAWTPDALIGTGVGRWVD